MTERLERIIEVKTPSLYITREEVRKVVPDLDDAPIVKTDGLQAVPLPLGTKIKLWEEGWKFGWSVIEKGDGEEVYVLFPFDDPAVFHALITAEGDIEERFASNWTVPGDRNIVIYMFKVAGFNLALGNVAAEIISNLGD